MKHRQPVAPLADARLTVPLPSTGLVARPRVSRLLDHAARHPLTVVVGGPGTGKTLAVATWARESGRRAPVAWISVDSWLSTPRRFWSAVTGALASALGRSASTTSRRTASEGEDVVADLAALVDGREVVLVLDDVHELGDEVLTDLDQVLRMPPSGLTLILVTRHDPPLSLNRHRVAGRLAEVRVADLVFTPEEVGALLHESNLAVPHDVISTLVQTSGGWPALLRLALLTMQAAQDPVAAGRQFSAQQPMVAGYLGEEVLGQLPREHQEFLVRTGVPARICAPLATALTGDPAAAARLAEIFDGDLLMVELQGSGWYRYHPLLRQTLQARLRQEHADLEPELHRRSSRWFEAHGEWLPALEHAIESGDHHLAVQLVLRSAAVELFTTDWADLPVLIERIPRVSEPQDPELQVVLAIQAFLVGQDEAVLGLLARAEDGVSGLPEPRRSVALLCLRVMEALEAGRVGDAQTGLRAIRQAQQLSSDVTVDEAPGWALFRDAATVMRGIAEMWTGHPRAALSILLGVHADDSPPAPGRPGIYTSGYIALAQALAGQLEPARERALTTLRDAEGAGRPRSHEAAVAWCALAMARVQQGDAEGAVAAADSGERAAARTWPDPCVTAGFHLVRVQHALLTRDARAARRWLGEVDADLRQHPHMTYAVHLRLILGAEVALLFGTGQAARERLAELDARRMADGGFGDEHDPAESIRGHVLLATGRAEEVPAAVAREVAARGQVAPGAWVAAALAHHRLRQDALATDALAHALDAAAEQREVRVFRQAGDELQVLLQRHEQVVGSHPDLVRTLLTCGGAHDRAARAAHLIDPLTERELAVLAFLPTMSSNAEIAAELGISVNTVKRHLKSVHRKLGVSSRRDAAREARRLDLLPG